MANKRRVSTSPASYVPILYLQASAIHFERELVRVSWSSISSKRERGKVMDIAVVGSADLLRLIVGPPGKCRLVKPRHGPILCSVFGC